MHETYDHWSVPVLTVTEHFIYSNFWFFFQIGCFLHWIQSVNADLFCSLYFNGSPLYLGSPSGLLCWLILIVPEVVLNLVYLSIFSGLAALKGAVWYGTYDHWSIAVLTVTEHFIYSHFWFFFRIGYFLNWIQSVYPHLFCSLYDNGSPLYLWSPSGLFCWWILTVPEVFVYLVYLFIFSELAALMSADITRKLWSLLCSCLNSYWTFHSFPLLIFFKLVVFCTEFNLFTPICFVSLYYNGSPLYLGSASGLLSWLILIVREVVLDLVYLSIFSGLAAVMSADIARNLWSLVCSCLNSYWTFQLFPLLIFSKLVVFWTEFNLFTPICFLLFIIMDLPYIYYQQVGYSRDWY